MNDAPLPPIDTTEAHDIVLAVLVDRLGGSVTITERELHAMRDSLRHFTVVRNHPAMEWTLALLPDPGIEV